MKLLGMQGPDPLLRASHGSWPSSQVWARLCVIDRGTTKHNHNNQIHTEVVSERPHVQ